MIRELPRHLATLCLTAWIGGMWMLGYVVVPTLFQPLPDRQLAGMIAGKLFTQLAFLGIACALYLLFYQLHTSGRAVMRQPRFHITAVLLALVLIGEFALQPVLANLKLQALPLDVMASPLASTFKAWHAVSGILFLIQSLLGVGLVITSARSDSRG